MATNSFEETQVSSSQWTFLPDDILHLITDKLHSDSDYVRFSAVCKDWLSFCHKNYKEKHHLHTNQQLPLLLHSTQFHKELRGLYSITKNMSHDQIQLQLPNKRCCGSSHGWLFFGEEFNKSSLELILINPFLGKDEESIIKLPPIRFTIYDRVSPMDQHGVYKAILSKDPHTSPDDYEVIVIFGCRKMLAHYKSGEKFWSYQEIEMFQGFDDVIFHKDSIFAVDRYHSFVRVILERFKVIPIRGSEYDGSQYYIRLVTIKKKFLVRNPIYPGHSYLVENSTGDLLLVRRYYWEVNELMALHAQGQSYFRRGRQFVEPRRGQQEVVEDHQEEEEEEEEEDDDDDDDEDEDEDDYEEYDDDGKSVRFSVYKLTMSPERKLKRLKNLGGEAFFLGDNHSISVSASASECPDITPDSIYYTDVSDLDEQNIFFRSSRSGIYNLKKRKKSELFDPSFSTRDMQPPIFVVPRFGCNPKRILYP